MIFLISGVILTVNLIAVLKILKEQNKDAYLDEIPSKEKVVGYLSLSRSDSDITKTVRVYTEYRDIKDLDQIQHTLKYSVGLDITRERIRQYLAKAARVVAANGK